MTAATITTEDRIRSAYAVCSDWTPGRWVPLAQIRTWLQDVDRTEVDRALRILERHPEVDIVPESNQKTLTARDRQAAVVIGNQDKHLIAIW